MGTVRVNLADFQGVGGLFAVLASPARSAIVHLLAEREHTAAELKDAVGLSQSMVAHHLRELRSACLVVGRREGRTTRYRLIDDHVTRVFQDAWSHVAEHGGCDPQTPDHD